ncbi:GPI ethanolamine phosphate transferase 1 [Phytophthora idaei]|nr:GPI ethanolamine phosphate transferase 1 [Phytophthora idaei]
MTKVGGGLARLLVLGVFFHALYVLSIFDIYFTSPVVPHIESVAYTDSPPAKRVVVFVADGCRADKFFETNASTNAQDANAELRVSFLRNMMQNHGSWGVSHTRVPTESRPGHVALFAGMYEDVSAVTKGWADNPVDFDSVFNQSSSAFLFGSPDIVPMFARHVPQALEEHYSHEEEDFAKGDASELDVWVFRRLQKLLNGAKEDSELHTKLHSDGVVVFCHYLGIDSNGHAHRPNSQDYLNNIALVDELVEKTHRMVEDFYDYDGRTAYVFTADHGMGLKGAHGDGDPANTRTPLVVWGAGVQGPTKVEKKKEFKIDLSTQSRAQVRAQLQAQEEQEQTAVGDWGALGNLVRKDVMQADVAPLISALLGLPYPRNSVGVLPFSYLAKGPYRANAVRSNAQQLYLHALRKEQEKRSRTLLHFAPYGPFRDRVSELLEQLAEAYETSIQSDEDSESYERVEVLSQELIEICLATLEYFQRYDWFFLLGIVVLGYVGWMVVVGVAYLHPRDFSLKWLLGADGKQLDIKLVVVVFAAFVYLALEGSPTTYYLYLLFPLVFGLFTWNQAGLIQGAWVSGSSGDKSKSSWKRWTEIALICLCLELVVFGYERREIFGLLFSLLAFWPYIGNAASDDKSEASGRSSLPSRCWTISCFLISVFPYLPSEYGEHTALVNVGGLLMLLFTGVVHSMPVSGQTGWKSSSFLVSASPLALSLLTLHGTMQYLDGERSKPPFSLTVANWLLSGAPIVLLLVRLQRSKSSLSLTLETGTDRQSEQQVGLYVRRLIEVMLAFSPSFILLSIAYEVLFYVVLCAVLVSWLLLEAQASSSSMWREIQRAFVFLLLVNIAFFGTGNVASMSSFEISSTYRFVTVFAPFTMGALLVGKILIPFMVVACTFHLILLLPSASSSADAKKPRLPATRYFLLVVAMSDVLALHFLFLVKNEGSWKEIGNSISMFGIVNAQIVFIPLLFLLARAFVRDLSPATEYEESLHKKHQ